MPSVSRAQTAIDLINRADRVKWVAMAWAKSVFGHLKVVCLLYLAALTLIHDLVRDLRKRKAFATLIDGSNRCVVHCFFLPLIWFMVRTE